MSRPDDDPSADRYALDLACNEVKRLQARLAKVERERDEARAEIERLRAAAQNALGLLDRVHAALEKKLGEPLPLDPEHLALRAILEER